MSAIHCSCSSASTSARRCRATSASRSRAAGRSRDVIMDSLWPTVWLVGTATLLSMVIGTLLGIHAAWKRGSATDTASTTFSMFTYSMPDFWLGMVLLRRLRRQPRAVPDRRLRDAGSDATGLAAFADHAWHMTLPAATLALAYIGEYMILMRASMLDTVREDYLDAGPGEGPARRPGPPPPRRAQRPAPARQPVGAELRLRAVGRHRRRDDLLLAGPRPGDVRLPSRARTTRCCRACSCCSRRAWSSPTSSPTCSTATSTRGSRT